MTKIGIEYRWGLSLKLAGVGMLLCLPLLASFTSAAENSAKEDPIDLKLNNSLHKYRDSRTRVAAWTAAEQQWDAELNRVYRECDAAMTGSDKDGKLHALLLTAEKDWLVFRDAEFQAALWITETKPAAERQGLYARHRMNIVRDRVWRLRGGTFGTSLEQPAEPEGVQDHIDVELERTNADPNRAASSSRHAEQTWDADQSAKGMACLS
jgi:uncharacterized protein YecT (DUF1311 family)